MPRTGSYQSAINIIRNPPDNVPTTPPRPWRATTVPTPVLTPETKQMFSCFEVKYGGALKDVQREISLTLNQLKRHHEKSPQLASKVPLSLPMINLNSFDNYGPNPSGLIRKMLEEEL